MLLFWTRRIYEKPNRKRASQNEGSGRKREVETPEDRSASRAADSQASPGRS
jgi:hypothetical protein